MFNITDLNITISRGDTASLEITFEGDVPGDGDQVVMSIKTSPRNHDYKWEKSGTCDAEGKIVFSIDAEDTASLPFGTYYWDIRIFYADGQITTPFAPKAFKVVEVVTNDRES